MLAQLVGLVYFAVMVMTFGLSGYYWWTAYEQARPWYRQSSQENLRAHLAFNKFIWRGTVSDSARHNYLLSLVCACIALVLMTLFYVGSLPLPVVLLVASLTAVAIFYTARFWLRYRRHGRVDTSPPSIAR